MFLPLRPITRGRWRRARFATLLLIACALALYGLTISKYAFPGESASWITLASGLDVRDIPLPFLTSLFGKVLLAIPFGSLAIRFNFMMAIAGAFAVGWTFKIVWFLTFEAMREQSSSIKSSHIANFGGYVAAAAVATSLPFWISSTRFMPQTIAIAWLMGSAQLLIAYARSAKPGWLYIFGALYGIGAADSPILIAAAPIVAIFAFYIEWKLFWCQIKRLAATAAISLLTLTMAHIISAWLFLKQNTANPEFYNIVRLSLHVIRQQLLTIVAFLPRQLWIPVTLMGMGFALITLFASVQALDNRRSWSRFFVMLFLTAIAGMLLFNAPLTPWNVLSAKGSIPSATYILVGLSVGLLFAAWMSWWRLSFPIEVEDRAPHVIFKICRFCGRIFAPLIIIMIVISAALNFYQLSKDKADFFDRAANAQLDRLDGRIWVVSNGILDANMRILAYDRKIHMHILAPHRQLEKFHKINILNNWKADENISDSDYARAKSLLFYNYNLFIEDLFSQDEKINEKAICIGIPDIWHNAGWIPVPDGLAFRGIKKTAAIDTKTALAAHDAFWQEWKKFLDQPIDALQQQTSYRFRIALRRHMAFMANNLGVFLSDIDLPEDAFRYYQYAREIDPANISALLNLFAMVAHGHHPELKAELERDLRAKIADPKQRYALWSLSRTYGYVRNYDMFMQMGWSWALSSSPGAVLAGLRSEYALNQTDGRRTGLAALMASIYEMRGDREQSAGMYRLTMKDDPKNTAAISGLVRLALQQSMVDEARKILEEGENAGASKIQLRQDWAALYMISGDLPRARVLLQELADEQNAPVMTLAMLAMVMLEQNDLASVEAVMLPKIAKASGGNDTYFSLVIQGQIWQKKGKPFFRNALACFQRAALLRPDIQALQDVMLVLVTAMGDQAVAEARAYAILSRRPTDTYANFIIGSIRLEQGHCREAETYLRTSAANPAASIFVFNNLAQTLARLDKLEEALKIAEANSIKYPDRYEVWSTMAFVMVSAGRFEEAEKALGKAHALNQEDKRIFIIDAQLALKRNDLEAAQKDLAKIAATDLLSAIDRADYASVKESIAHLRARQ